MQNLDYNLQLSEHLKMFYFLNALFKSCVYNYLKLMLFEKQIKVQILKVDITLP